MAVVIKQKNQIRKSHDFESSNFRIEASSEAFRILSDGLYSDKIKAIIRELSTNAIDAIVDAGTIDSGYEAHLPTSMEPHFYIRDYGTGLEHEEVMKLYTTYFYSNKTHSNDFVGQLGLGSKSPFAYTDNFSVTSYQGGMKRVYSAIINEDGFPTINFITEQETDEPNGLKVGFPVKSEDINEFHEKAKEVYRWFKIQPAVYPANWEPVETEYSIEGEGYAVRKNRYEDSVAVMGNIAYPIAGVDLDGEFHGLLNTPTVIYFNIGDLSVTPSRESLSLNKRTIANLKEVLGKVKDKISEEVRQEFDCCDTLWEARCLAKELFGSYSSPLYHLNDVCSWSDVTWKGESVKYDRVVIRDLDGVYLYKFTNKSIRGHGTNNSVRKVSAGSFDINRDLSVFINDFDSDNGASSRCRHWVKENGKSCRLVRFTDDEAKQRFLDESGMIESNLRFASELPKPPRFSSKGGGGTGVRKDTVLKYSHDRWTYTLSNYWKSTEVDFDDGGVYVEISRYRVVRGDGENMAPSELKAYIKQIEGQQGEEADGLTVYGVKTAVVKRYEDHPDWISLDDMATDLVNSHTVEMNNLGIANANKKVLSGFDNKESWNIMAKFDLGVAINDFSSVVSAMFVCQTYIEENSELRQLAFRCGVKISGVPSFKEEELQQLEKDVFELHPMIKVLIAASNGMHNYHKNEKFTDLVKENTQTIKDYADSTGIIN
tara:strand:+ start:1278 stop:3416 length:2139 start_codon:yes stop_codon:yes gene_type:complete